MATTRSDKLANVPGKLFTQPGDLVQILVFPTDATLDQHVALIMNKGCYIHRKSHPNISRMNQYEWVQVLPTSLFLL